MRDQAALRRLVVIGRHHQRGVGPRYLRGLDQSYGLGGAVGPRPRDHRHPARCLPHHRRHDEIVFGVGQRRAFSGRADGDQPVTALFDVPVHQRPERVQIDLTALKRCDEGGKGSLEHGAHP